MPIFYPQHTIKKVFISLMVPCMFLPALSQAMTAEEALEKVKSTVCKDNQTIEQTLERTIKVTYQRDIGWRSFNQDEYFDIERAVLVNKGMEMRYRWRVDTNGTIKPESDRAEKLCG